MDRTIVYPGSLPASADYLRVQQNMMVALGFLARAALDTSTVVDGLACTQTTVPGMSVLIAPGSILSLSTVEPNAYGSLAADAADPLMKMGINIGLAQLGPMTAPVTSGQSVVYLVQAAFSETDNTPVVLPYYNSANPAVPYTGPSNSGAAQNTKRAQTVTLQLKQGSAATTGSQTTPAPDSGFTALYAITIANGQTTITAPNIAAVPTAPFLQFKIPALTPGFSRAQTFASSGTFTVPAGVTRVKVMVVGGGGGGGSSTTCNSSQVSAAPGGNSGAWGWKIITGLTPGATIAVTVGAAGNGGVAGGGNGGNGGASSFGAYISAPGGTGGGGVPANSPPLTQASSVAVNVCSGGDVNGAETTAGHGIASALGNVVGGPGGPGPLGGAGGAGTNNNGNPGIAPGAGGGGGSTSANSINRYGGAGAPGLAVVEF